MRDLLSILRPLVLLGGKAMAIWTIAVAWTAGGGWGIALTVYLVGLREVPVFMVPFLLLGDLAGMVLGFFACAGCYAYWAWQVQDSHPNFSVACIAFLGCLVMETALSMILGPELSPQEKLAKKYMRETDRQ